MFNQPEGGLKTRSLVFTKIREIVSRGAIPNRLLAKYSFSLLSPLVITW